jgi:hypothetical protein
MANAQMLNSSALKSNLAQAYLSFALVKQEPFTEDGAALSPLNSERAALNE